MKNMKLNTPRIITHLYALHGITFPSSPLSIYGPNNSQKDMQSTYEQWNSNSSSVNNSQQPPQGAMSNVLPADYLNFITSNLSSSQQDLLNSSTNWLNSSINLPPELRYQHLNGIVDEITKDDLLNSTNSLNFSFKNFSQNNSSTVKNRIPTSENSSQSVNRQANSTNHNLLPKQEKPVPYSQQNNQWMNQNQTAKSYSPKKPIEVKLLPKKPTILVPSPASADNNQPSTDLGTAENNRLVYPHSFSHHFSTLTLDQHNYLLQQQRQLFMSINTSNMVLHQQQQYQQFMYQQYMQQQESYTQMLRRQQQHQQQGFNGNKTYPPMNEALKFFAPNSFADTQSHKNNQHSMIKQPYRTLVSSSSSTLSSPTSPQSNSIPPNQSKSFSSSTSSNNSYAQQQQKVSDMNSMLAYNSPGQGPSLPGMFYPGQMEQANYPFFYPNGFNDGQMYMDQQNGAIMAKNRYLFKQPYRHHRRTGPANELHVRLEECLYQFKSLDNERKKIEMENLTMNKRQVSNGLAISIPRLSSNPSRVDRLVVDAFREYNKTTSLISKLDNLAGTIFIAAIQNTTGLWLERIYNVQAKRKGELMSGLEREKFGQPLRSNDDAEVILLASAINELATVTSKIRTTLWCAIQISNINYKQTTVLNYSTQQQKAEESIFQSDRTTNDFIKKIFQIKTDLVF